MSDHLEPSHVKDILEQLKALPLTGKVISVLTNIPCVIGLTHQNKIKIAPIPEKTSLKAALSGITASGWEHTIVAWTGEVVSAHSNAFIQLLERSEKGIRMSERTELDLDTDHFDEKNPPNYLDEFPKFSADEYDITISKHMHGELAALLAEKFKEKVVPVWYARSVDDKGTTEVQAKHNSVLRQTSTAMLYQTLHETTCLLDKSFDKNNYKYYERLNLRVAQQVVKTYRPGDIIWIHTHQHMLLAEILRKRLPSAIIVYSQNEPWASRKILPKLYNHHALMAALLGANTITVPSEAVLGDLHAYYDEQKFATEYASKVFPDHRCDIILAKVGLNTDELKEALGSRDVLHQVQTLRSVYANKRTILARARVDQLRGMLVVLGAFRHLLRTCPDWKGKLFLFIIITPNRLPGYTFAGGEITVDDVFKQVLDINSRYGSAAYVPVIYLAGNGGYRPRKEYHALLRVADAAISVNNQPSANDMCREFVVAQEHNCSPLLVVKYSRTPTGKADPPGPAGQLLYGEVYHENTTDLDALLEDALTMPEVERQIRARLLFQHFTQPTATQVATSIITETGESLLEKGQFLQARPLPAEAMLDAYKDAKHRLLICDYDGTFTPIVNNPDDAVPTKSLLEDLEALAELDGNLVYIVSGRSREFLEKHFGSIKALGLSAEHGCYFKAARDPQGIWYDYAGNEDLSWRNEVESMMTGLEEVYPGSFIERKEVAIVWHYRNAANHDDCFDKAMDIKAELEGKEFEHLGLAIMLGKANLEARPRQLSKGSVVSRLLRAFYSVGVESDKRFIFCAGDDTTDEDMFRAILSSAYVPSNCFTCLVGDEKRPTVAHYRVDGPEDVVKAVLDMANRETDSTPVEVEIAAPVEVESPAPVEAEDSTPVEAKDEC